MKPIEIRFKYKEEDYEGELEIIDYKIGDCGYGSYEFWGSKGFDSQPCVDDIEANVYIFTEEGNRRKLDKDFANEVVDMIWDEYYGEIEKVCFENEQMKMEDYRG